MHESRPPRWLSLSVEYLSVVLVAGIALSLVRLDLPAAHTGAVRDFRAPMLQACGSGAYLRGDLYGDLQQAVAWREAALRCAAVLRPDGAGLRLMFGPATPGAGPLFVIGLAARPEDIGQAELTTNLTIIDQGRGRFFNSGDGERCWTQARVTRETGPGGTRPLRVEGRLYCAGALAEVNGPGTVTPGEFEFAGYLPPTPE